MLVAASLAIAGGLGAPVASAQVPFENCTQAKKAGYQNIPSSSPYCGEWLDSDNDGIGCESS
ncbi:excalibur calcium-binding domain-containing protein [Mycolicibacterium pyrenivorans]|uniref:excalibur calcium-binding domain-containing protein n=1 Tax=Mycolicibacterium pyrenivorans TaxID=187102 RepID=UPI0021F25959|nr:excalibur calcium-binding domain-containing protein [Mycolicibacterium pyrenivorans]